MRTFKITRKSTHRVKKGEPAPGGFTRVAVGNYELALTPEKNVYRGVPEVLAFRLKEEFEIEPEGAAR